MPGTAAVHNPAGPADQQIHLFYNTNNTNIALELRSEKKTTDTNDQVWASSSTDQPGFVVNPSQLASAPFAGTELVVGFTKKLVAAGTTATTNDVSIVSPVYQSVGSTEVNNTTIAACASDDTAWIYFLTGTDANSTQIEEAVFGLGTPSDFSNTNKILPGSSLAAYYVPDSDQRFVIYQANSDSLLREFTIEGGDNPISNATDAEDKTTLAVKYVKGKAYLYYTHKKELRRIVKDSDGWGTSGSVKGAHKVDADSQITVVSANGYNHLFYVSSGDPATKLTHVMDAQ